MARPFPVIVGVIAAVVLGTGVSAATIRSGDDRAAAARPTGTSLTSTTGVPTTTTAAPATTVAPRPSSTTRPTVRPTSTTPAPAPVATLATTTTSKPVLSRAAATQGLCQNIGVAVRQVVDGNTLGGGLRLVRAVNTYADAADPAVVGPARRMISSGLNGDLDASAAATSEAHTACAALGFAFPLPGGVQCIQAPCP